MGKTKHKYASEEESRKVSRCLDRIRDTVFDEFGTEEDAVYWLIAIACHFAARTAYCGFRDRKDEKILLDTIKLQLDMMHMKDDTDRMAIAG